MKAVIPAAGKGTRLRPLTDDTPKALVEVGGTPILTHCFEQLRDVDVDEFVVVVGYRMDDIVAHYGDAYRGTPITYAHQREQRGLGHAVLKAAPHVDDTFVLLNGDNVVRADLAPAVERQRRDDVDAVVRIETVALETARTGGVVVTNEDGRVVELVEKPDDPPSTLVNAGCHVLPPAVFHACELVEPGDRGEYELSDAIDLLVAAGQTVQAVPLDGWRVNVNTPADVERAKERLTNRGDTTADSSA